MASNREAKDMGESWAKILISLMPIRKISELYTQRQRDVYMGFDCCHILNGHKYTHAHSRRDRWDRYQREVDGRGQRDFPPFRVICSIMMTHSVCVDSLQMEAGKQKFT